MTKSLFLTILNEQVLLPRVVFLKQCFKQSAYSEFYVYIYTETRTRQLNFIVCLYFLSESTNRCLFISKFSEREQCLEICNA